MDALNAKNELIDQYLKGELTGQALDDFVQKLDTDPELKKDVELRSLMVLAIQEHGAAKLKAFIRSKTTQKQAMKVSFRAWYYAAAAVGLILIASTIFLIYRPTSTRNNSEIVAINDSVLIDTSTSATSHAQNSQKFVAPEISDKLPEANLEELPAFDDDKASAGAGESNNVASPYPDVVIIASNIPIIPIRIESELGEIQTMSAETVKEVSRKKTRQNKAESPTAANTDKRMDSAIAWANDQEKEDALLLEQATKFKLSFMNTREAVPMVSLTKSKTTETTEVMVYNLPYDNPLIFNYENKYYLKAGEKYYELNMNKTGKQNVTAITEPTLLEALNR